jgi:hypothetical protein
MDKATADLIKTAEALYAYNVKVQPTKTPAEWAEWSTIMDALHTAIQAAKS